MSSTPGLGKSPGEGHGNPLQCSCLENPVDRGAWWVTVHGVAKSQTKLKQLSTHSGTKTVTMYILVLYVCFGDDVCIFV